MGVRDMDQFLERWEMDVPGVRRRMILAPVPRERERWYALWLLTQGWTAQATAEALERDPHTIGRWLAAEASQQAALKGAVQELPANSGIGLANWALRQAQEESGLPVRLRALRYQPEPQHLPDPVSSTG